MKKGIYVGGLLFVAVVLGSAAEPDPRARAKIETLEKLLPEAEKAADGCERALAPPAEKHRLAPGFRGLVEATSRW